MVRLWMCLGLCAIVLALQRGATAQENDSLVGCIAALRHELPLHPEVSAQTFELYTRQAHDLRAVIESAAAAQPEFQLPIWDYLARRVDAQRVAQGRELMRREAAALQATERRHGVDAATTVAVFGVETDYGRVSSRYPVIDATLSRACLNLRSSERKQHFFAALRLVQEGVVKPEEFTGSWAGAFGMTQFMPATFARFMSDGDGGAPADIIHSVPDALATTARYLGGPGGLGWRSGLPWGVEVKSPPDLAQFSAPESDHACLAAPTPLGKCRSAALWSAAGVVRVDGSPLLPGNAPAGGLDPDTRTALLMPAGARGPAWLVTPNYQAIWRYNRADAYALAIGLLSDALRGGPPQQVAWPTDDPGLSRAEFRELQTLLVARGHCEVSVDGAEGPRTSAAVREEEARLGWPPTGRSGAKLLSALRAGGIPSQGCALIATSPSLTASGPASPSAAASAPPSAAAATRSASAATALAPSAGLPSAAATSAAAPSASAVPAASSVEPRALPASAPASY